MAHGSSIRVLEMNRWLWRPKSSQFNRPGMKAETAPVEPSRFGWASAATVTVVARRVPERFLVAFSLAGEQRDFVKSLAEEIERRLGDSTVFYDEWFEFYLAGSEADLKLQRIYGDQSELVVICISDAYGTKPWTRAEYAAVRARYMKAAGNELDSDRILPVRVGDGDVEGLHFNDIVPDLRSRTIHDAAQLILDRLSRVSPNGVETETETETETSGWPQRPPDFHWPIADHAQAQQAFCSLLRAASPVRLLAISGASETGKSSLARQMESNVARIYPEVRCGRFDFKGTAYRSSEVENFAESLDVNVPDVQGSNDQLKGVLNRLSEIPKPTLVIFDSYEQAGDVQEMIEGAFFTRLVKAEWLRVVVLGQNSLSSLGSRWEFIMASPVKLEAPQPEAWFELGRRFRSDANLTLDEVIRIHGLSGGKPSTLAALFGPR
jgi:TIR domain